MQNHQAQRPALERAPEANRTDLASSAAARIGGAVRNASLVGTMPGASFTSKWYGNPERLKSPYKRPIT